jgi:hypothetical protein
VDSHNNRFHDFGQRLCGPAKQLAEGIREFRFPGSDGIDLSRFVIGELLRLGCHGQNASP